MAVQTTFKRYEVKYLLSSEQKAAVLAAMRPYMALDQYGRTTIRNIYYDTENYRLARHSIERPAYKEKLRVRSYGPAGREDRVFVELKKKYDGVVYKRRLTMKNSDADDFLAEARVSRLASRQTVCEDPDLSLEPAVKEADRQIASEIAYFRDFYGSLRPAAFLSYEREAYYAIKGGDFRVTFDENILARTDDMTLDAPIGGKALIPEGMTLMEIKCSGGYPLWMVRVLSDCKCYKTSFSKYGTCYQTMILPQTRKIPAWNPAREKVPAGSGRAPQVSYSRAV